MPTMIDSTTCRVFRVPWTTFAGWAPAGGQPAATASDCTGNRSLGTGSPQRGHGVRGCVAAGMGGSSALQKGQAAVVELMVWAKVVKFEICPRTTSSAANIYL